MQQRSPWTHHNEPFVIVGSINILATGYTLTRAFRLILLEPNWLQANQAPPTPQYHTFLMQNELHRMRNRRLLEFIVVARRINLSIYIDY